MVKPTALEPTGKGGKQYHIDCKSGDLSRYLLIPGDPSRVEKIAKNWDDFKEITYHRQFKSVTGHYKGVELSCTSTGIGAASTALVLEEAAKIGVDTFIRVGSTGALQPGIKPGDLIISTGGLSMEGTSKNYIKYDYPSLANYEVVLALIEACEKLGFKYYLGITASTDSFYVGEGRPGFKGYIQSHHKPVIEDLRQAKVVNFEMESSALFTIASLYGLRAGTINTVYDNILTGEFAIKGEKEVGFAASEAVVILAEWDKLKKKMKKRYFYPSLLALKK